MNGFQNELIVFTIWRMSTLFVGTFVLYLGYRMFNKGVLEKNDNEVSVQIPYGKFVLRNGTPGMVLAIVGGIIIWYSIYKGWERKTDYKTEPASQAQDSASFKLPENDPT